MSSFLNAQYASTIKEKLSRVKVDQVFAGDSGFVWSVSGVSEMVEG